MRASYRTVEDMLAALRPSYPVFCLRPGELARTARRFLDQFPGKVLYAVKCNPHPAVLRALYGAGVRHFDTASLTEIALVREMFDDAVAYYHHPVKGRAAIGAARRVYGVECYTVDHEAELAKVIEETGGGIAVQVRMATPPGYATFDLSRKFGASPELAARLLRDVAGAGLEPGLSFHVGSQCINPEAYSEALRLAGRVLDDSGVAIRTLNVGGGFPAAYTNAEAPPFECYMEAIEKGAAALGLPAECELMCEPGRALVAGGCSLVVQVHLRKNSQIYVNDGIFGSLSELKLGDLRLPARLVRLTGAAAEETQPFTVFGPTCDALDVMPGAFHLPADVREGDWIEIGQVGAYSNAIATEFNGFRTETFVNIDDGS